MASNHTEHYQLSQWEPGDKVKRLDFNGDNEKIDAAIKAASDLAGAATRIAQDTAEKAYSPENIPVVFGSYTGDGTQKRLISLEFTPRIVFVLRANGATYYGGTTPVHYYGGAATIQHNANALMTEGTEWQDKYTIIAITTNGFWVNYSDYGNTRIESNTSGTLYHYLAFR